MFSWRGMFLDQRMVSNVIDKWRLTEFLTPYFRLDCSRWCEGMKENHLSLLSMDVVKQKVTALTPERECFRRWAFHPITFAGNHHS
jgi:hypothetical protein